MVPAHTSSSPVLRLVVAGVAAFILSASLPSSGYAASDAGIWKIVPTKSKMNDRYATVTIQRVEDASASSSTDSFIAISGMGVYRLTGAALESRGLKPVDFTNMTRTGEAVLIGVEPRSKDGCGFKCRAGLPETVRTVTFRIVKTGQQQVRDMLAYDDETW